MSLTSMKLTMSILVMHLTELATHLFYLSNIKRRTKLTPIVPNLGIDNGAQQLLEELFITSQKATNTDWTADTPVRQTANGTKCPKHRRLWYLKSRGMPTGF